MHLMRLVLAKPEKIRKTMVISLTTLGEIGERLRARGVLVQALEMKHYMDIFLTVMRLIKLIRRYQPRIVCTQMYHANLIGGVSARLAGSPKIIWSIHSTSIHQGVFSTTYCILRLCAALSYFIPNKIICVAQSSKTAHIKLKYARNKLIVIPNGYDFSTLKFDPISRNKLRNEMFLDDNDLVIGVVGRFDPLKDFYNFVMAARLLVSKLDNVKFLMVGRGNEWSNSTLRGWIDCAGLTERFRLTGQQLNVSRYYSAMDIFCLSSVSEAFPNVVVEAMACGLPCVVTRAGDAAVILGDEKFVVPVKNSDALAGALFKLCSLDPVDRKVLGDNNARKVKNLYSLENIIKKYDQVTSEK